MVSYASGVLVLVIMVLIGLFLGIRGTQAISRNGMWSFLTTQD